MRRHDHENYDPDWVNGSFVLACTCSNSKCSQSVIFQGNWKVVYNNGDPEHGDYGNLLMVRTIDPHFHLLRVPDSSPEPAKAAIASAAKIIWLDPSSAAGRLRTAVERVLDDQGISATIASGGWRNADRRISEFQKSNPLAGDAMMAVKWIGNSGAHDDQLTSTDVLDGATVLELALKVVYDMTDAATIDHINAINAAKGLPTRP
jgi:hypothetical protein